jgi:hypothetical protein
LPCTLAQSFLFAPPLDTDEVPAAAEARHA